MAREKTVETAIIKQVNADGGITFKFVSPGNKGVPDRVCIFNTIGTVFVEVKSPTGKLSAAQVRVIALMRKKGATVWIVDSLQQYRDKYDMSLLAWINS